MSTNPNLKPALEFIDLGWPVIPIYPWVPSQGCACAEGKGCHVPAKHPPYSGWRVPENQARTHDEAEHVWAEGNLAWNVAIVTGEQSGVFVLDVDPDAGGTEALHRLLEDHGELPYTRVHRTGSGGSHYLFRMPENQDISNSNKNLKAAGYRGLDIRGTGGYVLAPGSKTGKGDYSVKTSASVAEAPDWFLELLLVPEDATGPTPTRSDAWEYDSFPDDIRASVDVYCAAAVTAELKRFEDEYHLEGWDILSNTVSFSLLMLANSPWNNLDAGDIVELLEEHGNTDSDGFPPSRLNKCITSALNAVERKDLFREIPPQIQEELDAVAPVEQVAPNRFKRGDRTAILTSAADIKMKRSRWVWRDRIALGTLALVAGQPGLGKSTLVYELVAMLTNGTLHGEFEGTPKDAIICATEDSWEYTIVPRLVAANADRSRVFRVDIENKDDVMEGLNLMTDQALLEEIVKQKDIGLLVLDPLMSRMGEKDTHKDADVRKALEPMCAIADKCQFAIIGLMHHNKSGSTDPLRSVMGSTAFGAVARSVHTVISAPEDEDYEGPPRRMLGTIKNNLGQISGTGHGDLKTWMFYIESVTLATEDDDPKPLTIGRLRWAGDADFTIMDGMHEQAKRERDGKTADKGPNKLEAATLFLTKLFETRGGPVLKSECEEIGAQAMNGGHLAANLDRAIRKMPEFDRKRAGHNGKAVSYWGFAEDIASL